MIILFRIGIKDSRSQAEQTFYSCLRSFQFQNYLNFVKVKKYRNVISSFKCYSHRLEIESGRWNKPIKTPVDERLCKNCNAVENEFHF